MHLIRIPIEINAVIQLAPPSRDGDVGLTPSLLRISTTRSQASENSE